MLASAFIHVGSAVIYLPIQYWYCSAGAIDMGGSGETLPCTGKNMWPRDRGLQWLHGHLLEARAGVGLPIGWQG